jgi:GNAT superfamily N-acetyltransferase
MGDVTFRQARAEDLDAIVALLTDDPLGATRESGEGSADAYARAFAEIEADPNNFVIVADDNGEVVGTFQITFIPNISFEGGRRALVEAVRIADSHQGTGLGRAMMAHAADLARERDCKIVQLTSNKQRPGAIAFYEKIGFEPSHIGFKLHL